MYRFLTGAVFFISAVTSAPALAQNYKIEMLDTGADKEIMVFEPAFLKASVGDTVTFVAKTKGHNMISRLVPAGASSFKGQVDKDLTITLDKEGVYIYECDLHVMLGMLGVIQAGKATNLDEAKVVAEKLKTKMAMKSERLDSYIAQIK